MSIMVADENDNPPTFSQTEFRLSLQVRISESIVGFIEDYTVALSRDLAPPLSLHIPNLQIRRAKKTCPLIL